MDTEHMQDWIALASASGAISEPAPTTDLLKGRWESLSDWIDRKKKEIGKHVLPPLPPGMPPGFDQSVKQHPRECLRIMRWMVEAKLSTSDLRKLAKVSEAQWKRIFEGIWADPLFQANFVAASRGDSAARSHTDSVAVKVTETILAATIAADAIAVVAMGAGAIMIGAGLGLVLSGVGSPAGAILLIAGIVTFVAGAILLLLSAGATTAVTIILVWA